MTWLIKFGLLLSIGLFGIFMLLTGLTLSGLESLPGWLKPSLPEVEAQATAEAIPTEKETSPTESSKEKSESSDPVQLSEFMLPRVPPEKAKYTLEVGLYAKKSLASDALQKLEEAELKSQWFEVKDSQGIEWFLLAAGTYPSQDEARRDLYRLLNRFSLSNRIVLLPPSEK